MVQYSPEKRESIQGQLDEFVVIGIFSRPCRTMTMVANQLPADRLHCEGYSIRKEIGSEVV